MSVTYTDTPIDNTVNNEAFVPAYARNNETFVPSYARGARRKKPVRTWMILAPIGALALIGGGAMMMMQGEPTAAPLAEPAVVQPLVATPAPLESSGLPSNASATIAAPTPAPVARVVVEAPPSPPPAIQRRQPVERRAAPVAVTPRVETAPEPTGPQPYTAPATAAPSTPAPAISVTPLS